MHSSSWVRIWRCALPLVVDGVAVWCQQGLVGRGVRAFRPACSAAAVLDVCRSHWRTCALGDACGRTGMVALACCVATVGRW